MEYESDAPQFSTVWFLPVVSLGVTLAAILIRRFDAHPWALTRAALLVTAARLLIVLVLAGLGHSTPIVPPVLVVVVVLDLVHRRTPSSWTLPIVLPVAVHAAYLPSLPLMPHGAMVAVDQVVPSLLLSVLGAVIVVVVAEGRIPAPLLRGGALASLVALAVFPDAFRAAGLGSRSRSGRSGGGGAVAGRRGRP